MKKHFFLLLILFTINTNGFAKEFIELNPEKIAQVKQSLKNGSASAEIKSAYQNLLSSASAYLKMKNPSVMNKTLLPPSNDKHDYLSLSRYWWPDPNKKDGLPWIRKDGQTNPDTQTDAVDRRQLDKMCNAVRTLSLAYYFSDNEEYAKKGVSILKTWFLDKETLMNPNLNYAQSIPGKSEERATGILDGRLIPELILDSIILFSESAYWTTADNEKMNQWLNDYLIWLTESELGKAGVLQENNHGSWYKFNVAAVALYLDKKEISRKMVDLSMQNLDQQLDKNGGQTHELERTKPFFYSCFNLEALIRIAAIGEKLGINNWDYTSPKGSNLALALDFLIPAVQNNGWERSVKDFDLSLMIPILDRVPEKHNKAVYKETLKKVIKNISENKKAEKSQNKTLEEYYLLGGAVVL